MTMPTDLILVRHGQSEGNAANKRSRKGDHTNFTDKFLKRHNSQWRLTDLGKEQAEMAGEWVRENISRSFGRYYTSEYVRALETAALLGLPSATWYREFYLRERDFGQLDVQSCEERMRKYSDELKRRKRDGFFWAPPGGESIATVCLRVDRILNTLHRECSNMRVIIVCHGEVMWAFRARLERMTQQRFHQLDISDDPFDKIYNCQVLHYTRKTAGVLKRHFIRFRSICPTDTSLSSNEWQQIERPKHTNEDLLADVESIPRLIAT